MPSITPMPFRVGVALLLPLTLHLSGAVMTAAADPTDDAALRDRLKHAVEWLAAPEREGRGPGTKGVEQAADWVAEQLSGSGLDTVVGVAPGTDTAPATGAPAAGSAFQRFVMTLDAKLGPADANTAELVGPPGEDGRPKTIPLRLGKDFTPLAAGGSGRFDLPLVFAGYGITAPAEHYDDYAPLAAAEKGGSAKGAGVVLLRQEPQKDNPHSVFDGNQASQYAALARKVANASEHEAGGIIFCNDADADGDALMAFTRAGDGSENRTMPILQLRRSLVDDVVKASLGSNLDTIQKGIDDSLEPQSGPLTGWRIRGQTAIERTETEGRNVLAILPGVGWPKGDADAAAGKRPPEPETVVLGAHYDHLGYGGANSAAPGEHTVHHGADDNASGTALLVEVARMLKQEGPFPRTILFVAFSGEERGLLGSAHYAANAVVPLADTAAMVNLDMVGRLDGNKIVVHGTGTGTGLDALVDRFVAARGFEAAKEPGGFGPSDHSSFYARKIPVLHLFTGSHSDYHRPTDTAEKINYEGMVRIVRLVADIVRDLATAPERPAYIEVASKQFAGGGGDRPYFGSIPDFGKPGKGYAITGATKDSPAAKGGLKGGDVIVRLGESAVTGLEDFDSALRKHKGGETVPVVVLRDGAEVTLQITLDPPK
jgi:acetylornithine deacetylase/succinyl-diaminopimelate desuccinylase-like protein